jgi:MYXO-CTERM domain-containing protein
MVRPLRFLPAAALLLSPALAAAHPVTADGDPSEWMTRLPPVANLGMVARDAAGHGEHIWRDATADARTDVASPEVVADIVAFQVTGSAAGVGFLLRRQAGVAFTGQPIQVQIAVDMDRVAGSGMDYLAGYADTKVADGARWERLVQTMFGSGGKAQVIDTSFTQVAIVEAAQGAGGEVEIFVPWSALGLSAPPADPLRFTVATFRAQASDVTVDVGGASVSNVLDCVSDYGDPAAAAYPNTWIEVQDGVIDHSFDVHFDASGEVYAPLVVQRFVANATASAGDEWYAVRNTTTKALGLDGVKLGNQSVPDGAQGMFGFPAGLSVPAGSTFIVARSGASYAAAFGKAPDTELASMAAYLPWTNGVAGTMQLTDAGDELLVLDASNTILDVAVYGTGSFPGVNAFPTAPASGAVLTRSDASGDTDDCSVDFTNGGQPCTSDAQCGGICRACAANLCADKPQGAACPDANPCNGDEVCDGHGACVAGTTPPCDDKNPCTTDSCTVSMGCLHVPVTAGTSCSDGDVCNGVEVCDAAGVCQAGQALACADADPCTIDTCDKVSGCQHATAADGASCSDGDACNGAETCQAGVCTSGAAPSCDDQNPCTTDSCDKAKGCQHAAVSDGTACGDGDVCNGDEVCVAGACSAGTPLDCADTDPCTVDTCDQTSGCQHAAAAEGATCSTGACSGACTSGACVCGTGGAGGGTGGATGGAGGTTSTTSTFASGGGGGAGGATGSTSTGGLGEGSACACRTAGEGGDPALWVIGLGAAAATRRRRRR